MTDSKKQRGRPSLHDRLQAAEAAADQVVAEESGQLGSEISALAVPFEEAAAALRAAIHPDRLAEHEVRTPTSSTDDSDREAGASDSSDPT